MDIKDEKINVFEELKKEILDDRSNRSFDDVWKYIENNQTEEMQRLVYKMQYLIYKKRYGNLCKYLEKLKESRNEKYKEKLNIKDALKYLLFFDNPLNEFNYIGTDLYANALFIQSEVPYLYRCVGKDGAESEDMERFVNESSESTLDSDEAEKHVDRKDIVIQIFEHVLSQIEFNNSYDARKDAEGMYSYSKCFGLSLYKYANLLSRDSSVTFEIREGASLNSVFYENEAKSLHEFAVMCSSGDISIAKLPYFCVDMSNARDNDVDKLKIWIKNDMKIKREWAKYIKDIIDPIGDAEVVCNFTGLNNMILCNNVRRYTIIGRDAFCTLLYAYFKTYAVKRDEKEKGFNNNFDSFVKNSIETLPIPDPDHDPDNIQNYFNSIIDNYQLVNDKLTVGDETICIDWNNEINYMSRKNKKKSDDNQVPHRIVYKGDNAEWYSAIWKEILFGAVEQKYSNYDYSPEQM